LDGIASALDLTHPPERGPLAGIYATLVEWEIGIELLEKSSLEQRTIQRLSQSEQVSFRVTPEQLADPILLARIDELASLAGTKQIQVSLAAHAIHDKGADHKTELATALAMGALLLARFRRSPTPAPEFSCRLAINSAHLDCIAKLRAARLLWAMLCLCEQADSEITGQAEKPPLIGIHATTSATEDSHIDTWTNIIRASVGTAAGMLGSCTSMLIPSHDGRIAPTNPFGRRIARNTHNILNFESHLADFTDPLRGSFATETRTHELCHQSWDVFQQILESGGLESDLKLGNLGILGQRVTASRKKLLIQESYRKPGMLGVSEFPNANEATDIQNHEFHQLVLKFNESKVLPPQSDGEDILRLSNVFGAIRTLSVAHPEQTTFRFELLEPPQKIAQRISWTESTLAAAGFTRSLEKNTAVIVIVGSDVTYGDKLIPCIQELSRKNPTSCLVVAGRLPPLTEASARQAGLHTKLFSGCDCAQVLTNIANHGANQ
jgi:hypothetical protein